MFDRPSSDHFKWDLFISYATEDRDTVAAPLAESLHARGVKVWYDRFELKLGDSLRRSIDEGLRLSRFGVVILSPNFFAKEWPQRELDALYQRLIREGRPLILPVWYKLGAGEIAEYSPLLADILAAHWEEGLDAVVQQIMAVLQPNEAVLPRATRGKALAEVSRSLVETDYAVRIEELSQRYPTEDVLWALETIAFNIEQPAVIRGRALREILARGTVEADRWNTILRESDSDWLREVMIALTESSVILTADQVHILLANRALPRATSGFGRMVIAFIRRGAAYTSAVFLPGATYPFWEVKYDCVRSIIELDDRDSVRTLASFASMSYWKARNRIVDYLRGRIEQGRLSLEERVLAEQIITQIISDGKTDPKTPTMRKAREALAAIQGGAPGQSDEISGGTVKSRSSDIYADYEAGLTELLKRLKPTHPGYAEALVYQHRLAENIALTRRYGDTTDRSAQRAEIIDCLNNLAQAALGVSFNDLCLPASEVAQPEGL